MITEYYRPETLEEALDLISRDELTLAMGGGIVLNAPHQQAFAVADLQALGLHDQNQRGKFLELGAGVTLQGMVDSPDLQPELKEVVLKEATQNLRNQATIAGTLISADGRSPLACAMLALDAQLLLMPGSQTIEYGQLLHMRSGVNEGLPFIKGKLVSQVSVNKAAAFAYEYVARSPADRPIVTIAAAVWSSGRTRVVVGGWGRVPRLALDAPEPGGVEAAVLSATAESGDKWASAAYRQDSAVSLANRVVERLQ